MYKKINVSNIEDKTIDNIYKDLLQNKYQFMILDFNNNKYILTKERSIFKIDDENKYLNDIKHDIYYKTIINNKKLNINKNDLNLYKKYLEKYIDRMSNKKYGDKYYFGCIAVKTNNGFITTIRGKENFDDYTVILNVDHKKHLINAVNKKASLNAPLLDYLFKNKKVKVIVHLHEFDNSLPYLEYANPGTVRDSIRNNKTSFNIKYHGVIYLFDKDGNLL